LSSYQNFLYVVQGYDLGNPFLEKLTAWVVPWVELFLGAFLVLGLWLPLVLRLTWVLTIAFITVVTQAIIRELPLEECGCFGQLLSIPPRGIIIFDMFMLIALAILIVHIQKTSYMGLDSYYFNKKE